MLNEKCLEKKPSVHEICNNDKTVTTTTVTTTVTTTTVTTKTMTTTKCKTSTHKKDTRINEVVQIVYQEQCKTSKLISMHVVNPLINLGLMNHVK